MGSPGVLGVPELSYPGTSSTNCRLMRISISSACRATFGDIGCFVYWQRVMKVPYCCRNPAIPAFMRRFVFVMPSLADSNNDVFFFGASAFPTLGLSNRQMSSAATFPPAQAYNIPSSPAMEVAVRTDAGPCSLAPPPCEAQSNGVIVYYDFC